MAVAGISLMQRRHHDLRRRRIMACAARTSALDIARRRRGGAGTARGGFRRKGIFPSRPDRPDGGALRRGNRAGTPVPAPPGCGGSSTRMGGKAPAVTIARAGKTPTALRNPPTRRNKFARIRTFP